MASPHLPARPPSADNWQALPRRENSSQTLHRLATAQAHRRRLLPATSAVSAQDQRSRAVNERSRRHAEQERAAGKGHLRRTFVSALSAATLAGLSAMTSLPAWGESVRLQDVESRELQLALEAAISGDLERAEDLFGSLIDSSSGSSSSASMWSNRGSVRLSLGKFQEAAEDFSRAIHLAPYAAVPYLNRSIAYEALGRLDEAAQDCFSAIRNDPHESAAYFNLGNVEVKRGRYQDALDAYQTAADLSPGIAGYRLREANVLFQVGFTTDAEKLVRSIVRKYPNYAEAHAALAGMFWGEGSLSLAEEQLTEATEWEPNFKNLSWVSDNVQWPPKLLQAYRNFLTLK